MKQAYICSILALLVGSDAFAPCLRIPLKPVGTSHLSTSSLNDPFYLMLPQQIPIQLTKRNSSTEIVSTALKSQESDSEEDDDEYEYEEYESLTEADFYNSEWKIGTLWDDSNKIEETWFRCVVKESEFGAVEFIGIWGDGSEGKWNFDPSTQFFSISKDSFGGWLGKRIWAGSVDDYYYMQGTIRGWNPISPASVLGQWQAKRLGVDREEAGIAPWFETKKDITVKSDERNAPDESSAVKAQAPWFVSEDSSK